MHDHLEEGDGRDADVFEVVRVDFPWFCITNAFLFGGIVGVKGIFLRIDELDVIVELYLWGNLAVDQWRGKVKLI